MSKLKAERRLADNEAEARLNLVRVSPRKLNLLAKMIRGMPVGKALDAVTFSLKRNAKDVEKLLKSAIANAENNHGLDIDTLVVREATVGPALAMKRLDIKGRSRAGRIKKMFSKMRIVVSEDVR